MKRALLLVAVAAILPACNPGSGGPPPPPSISDEVLITREARVDKSVPGSVGDATFTRTAASGSNAYAVWIDNRNGISDVSGGGIWFNRSTDGGVTWQPSDVRIDRSPGDGFSILPQIAASGTHVWVVWQDGRNGYFDIYLNHSSDAGVTWLTQDLRLDTDPAGSGDSWYPQIAVAGSSVYVAWGDTRVANQYEIRVNRSLNDGASWLLADVRIDSGTNPGPAQPHLAATGTNVYVAWSVGGTGNSQMFMNRSTDQGSNWQTTPTRLDHLAAGQGAYGGLVACSGNSVYVVWATDKDSKSDVYLSRSTDGGATWIGTDTRLDTDAIGSGDSYPTALVCSGSNVYVGWYDYRTGAAGIYINRSSDNGVTWLASDLRIDTNPSNSTTTDVRLCISGSNVVAVWTDNRAGLSDGDIYSNRSADGGVTWLPSDVRLDHGGTTGSYAPDLCASGTNFIVAWQDIRNPQRRIYGQSSANGGATWGTSDAAVSHTLPAGTNGISSCPAVAVSGNDVYVAWMDYRNGQTDLFFNHSGDRGRTWNARDKKIGSNGTAPVSGVQIAATGAHVFVVWSDSRFGQDNVFFSASTNSGATFGADVRLNTNTAGAAQAGGAQIAATGDDLLVVWRDNRVGYGGFFCNRSANGGATWLVSDIRIDHVPVGIFSFDFNVSRSGSNAWVVWFDNRDGGYEIFSNHSSNGGASWSAADVRVDTFPAGSAYATNPQVASVGNTVYVAWDDARNLGSEIRFNRSLDGGVTWMAADVRVDTSPTTSLPRGIGQICAEGTSVYLVWGDNRTSKYQIQFNASHDSGATWLPQDVRIDANLSPDGSYAPQIGCHGQDVWIAWSDRRDAHPAIDGDSDIYLNHSSNGGAHWNSIDYRVDLGDPAHKESDWLRMVVDPLGPVMVWQDFRGGTSDIYAGGIGP